MWLYKEIPTKSSKDCHNLQTTTKFATHLSLGSPQVEDTVEFVADQHSFFINFHDFWLADLIYRSLDLNISGRKQTLPKFLSWLTTGDNWVRD